MDDAEEVYGLVDEAVEQLRIFRSWLPPLPHVLEEAVFVCAIMHNLRVIDLLEGAQAFLPDVGLVVPLVGPEGAFDRRSVQIVSKADQVVETPIRHTLDVHEDRRSLEGERGGSDNGDLGLLEREGLQLVVVPNRQHAGRSILFETPSPRSVAVGKLCDG